MIDTNGQGHGALAELLKVIGADVLICGGIGGGAQIAIKISLGLTVDVPSALAA